MNKKQPTKKQLRQIFQLSRALLKLHPWDSLSENLVFAVKLPDVNAYVSFIGQLGETMGVIAYLGEAAINRIKHMNCPETLINTPMLALTYDSFKEVDEADAEIADRIDFDWENNYFCPSFRVNQPGYFPWTFDRENCEQFITILQQTIEVIKTTLSFSTFMDINGPQKKCFFRVKQEDGAWISTSHDIHIFKNTLIKQPSEEILNGLRKLPVVIDTIQASCLILPTPLGNEEKPKVGYFFMLVDDKTEQVIAHDLFQSSPGEPSLLEKIFSILAEEQLRPKNIAVAEDNLLHDLIQEMLPFELPVQVIYKESTELVDKLVLELFDSIDEEYEEYEENEHDHGCGCNHDHEEK